MSTPILTIAALTLREAARRRLLAALVVLTAVVVVLTAWGFSRIPTIMVRGQIVSHQEALLFSSQLLILVMFMFSGVLALSSVFIASPSIAGEVESGISLAMQARPLRRAETVLGKWLGLAAVVVVYTIGAAGLELLLVNAVVGYTPPRPFLTIAFLIAEGLVLLTFALLLSTRLPGMTGGIIATVLFFVAWMAGVVGGFGIAFNNPVVMHVGTVSRLVLPTDGLWRGAIFALEPASVLAATSAARETAGANPFFVASAPPTSYILWCAAWIVVILGSAIWSFTRREL